MKADNMPLQRGTNKLETGTRLLFQKDTWTVFAFAGTDVLIKRQDPVAVARVSASELLWGGSYTVLPDPDSQESEGLPPESYGALASRLTKKQRKKTEQRIADVNEVLTGYKSGSEYHPAPDEPRPEYDPEKTGLMQRYEAKAAERAVSLTTVRNHVRSFHAGGGPSLVDGRSKQSSSLFHACDPLWLEVAEEVLKARQLEPKVSRTTILRMIHARFYELYKTTKPEPGRTSAFRALAELDADLADDAKARRSKAAVPAQSFGHFHATRPGQYVLLDTTTVDMFTLDPITLAPCRLEVTAAMDLYSRCIVGLRVATESTKSIDVSSVLFEMIQPREAPAEWPVEATWPYHGVPEAVIWSLHESPAVRFTGPGMIPDAIVTDHGKIYVSNHVKRMLDDMGTSIFPARKYTPTDKSPLERWFETLEGLLQLFPGYSGKDANDAGASSTKTAHYLPSDLEKIIRELTALHYHLAPSSSEADDETPGLHLSPVQRYAQGIAAAGHILLPRDPGFAFRLLPEVRRKITQEGVAVHGLIYRAPVLGKYRDRHSMDHNAGRKWSFRINTDDLRQIYFQDPKDKTWHAIPWERTSEARRPFNGDALALAKSYAKEKGTHTSDELLGIARRWGAGLELNAKERKAAHRVLAQDAALRAALQRDSDLSDTTAPEDSDDGDEPFEHGSSSAEHVHAHFSKQSPVPAVDEQDYYSEAADLL